MSLIGQLIDTFGRGLIEANKQALEEQKRQRLKESSIDVEYKVISDEKIEPKKLL